MALIKAAESWDAVIKREREAELIFRGEEYSKAIRDYRKEHGNAWPTKLEQLSELGPKETRYIRRPYPEPFTGEWGLLTLPGGEASGPKAQPVKPSSGGSPNKVVQPGKAGPPVRKGGKEGLPITGVYCPLDEEGFKTYHKEKSYSDWLFSPLIRVAPSKPSIPGGGGSTPTPQGETSASSGIGSKG